MSQSALVFNAPSTFNFDATTVRIVVRDDGPWFVAKDVMAALEYSGHSAPAKVCEHIPEEWKGVNPVHTLGGEQKMLCLSEPGLYFFLGRSDKPKALPFQKKVAGEVLPSIRKTGGYGKRDHQFVQDAILASSRIAAEAQQHIFAALMNDEDWRNHRWIVNFIPDRRDGKLIANIMQIASDDMCVSMKNLAARILDVAGSHPTDQQLNDIAIACNQRLSWRIQHREKQEAAKKSQAGGALAVA